MEEEGFGGQMDDESFMDMLRSGDEEDYVFSPTSCLSSLSSSFYSSAMLCFGVKQEETVAVVRGASQKSTDSSLSSLSSSPPSTIITRSQSPTKVSPFNFLNIFLTDDGRSNSVKGSREGNCKQRTTESGGQ
ncbi:hypothetical protein ZIOFF_072207 [Zingiber officinale]|uniref:Uncharacterized protein n=1 Tax=Zingiber officinale TaxID=94328 RepID=A0A8J5C2V5_ZINOF|nr:hypothetical protein ZIOFF_072207 [Zingiber officinale]